jgi:hypothetical protein
VIIGNKDKKPDSGASTLPSSTPEQNGSPANSSDKVTGAAAPPPEAKKSGDPRIKELVEASLKRGPDEAKLALAEEYKQRILQVEGKFSRDSTYQALFVDGLQARGMRGGDVASAASSEGAALAIQEGAMATVGATLGGAVSKGLTRNDFPAVAEQVSQKQLRHIEGRPEYRGGGFLSSIEDAQAVLNAYTSGSATVLGKNQQGFPIVRVDSITGTNVNQRAGITNQPTNIFMIKGTASPSVVPMNPNWSPK